MLYSNLILSGRLHSYLTELAEKEDINKQLKV